MGGDTFKYSLVDFFFTLVGLVFFLLDVVLDIWAVVSFYQEGDYIVLGLLLLFLLGSSALTQIFSWLFYQYEDELNSCALERCLNTPSLVALHVCQMGVYLRYACVVEVSIESFTTKHHDREGYAAFLSADLSMLRLIETFSESAPQLCLMLTIIIQRGHLDPLTMLKAAGSVSAIACGLTMYHRSLRSTLPNVPKQNLCSSCVHFVWNLLLLVARLVAIALFASVLPCYIFTHFICSWMIFFFFAWRSQGEFMDSPGGEWLYRATVGLIWYFSWFNLIEGQTRYTSMLYHVYVMFDLVLLCGLWCWQIYKEQFYFGLPAYYTIIISVVIIALYIIGLSVKGIYYKCFHPRLETVEQPQLLCSDGEDTVDFPMVNQHRKDRENREHEESLSKMSETEEQPPLRGSEEEDTIGFRTVSDHEDRKPQATDGMGQPQTMKKRENKRMKKLAQNFYS